MFSLDSGTTLVLISLLVFKIVKFQIHSRPNNQHLEEVGVESTDGYFVTFGDFRCELFLLNYNCGEYTTIKLILYLTMGNIST